ncbi:hypothetical protein KIPB_012744 [Kipferlia bialata]|uniref:Uncharacterized protein n=1 Tax=Kipferlia bialata TaxID=797122 RepID=A0A391NRN9_9EUKA|nr:hypothetical protein KIPB_012744 [Kipferlia bialata]|eukprot:g12744.t1
MADFFSFDAPTTDGPRHEQPDFLARSQEDLGMEIRPFDDPFHVDADEAPSQQHFFSFSGRQPTREPIAEPEERREATLPKATPKKKVLPKAKVRSILQLISPYTQTHRRFSSAE